MSRHPALATTLLACLLSAPSLPAAVRLPALLSDGMVLQRDTPAKVWGWAEPGEGVSVEFRAKRYSTQADAAGRWTITLDAQPAGGPDSMTIAADDDTITLRDVLVGDVWICSGQSNMTHQYRHWQERYAEEIARADERSIRQFQMPTTAALRGPLDDVSGPVWKTATAEHILDFGVVAHAFAAKLHARYGVPQGIVLTAVGGTRIEAWTSADGLRAFPDLLATAERNADPAYVDAINEAARRAREAAAPALAPDEGSSGPVAWFDPAYQPRGWKPITVPGWWEDQGVRDLDGVVWYRREIDLPAAVAGKEAKLKLGRIVDADEVWMNGTPVGNTTYQYPQRRYTVPAGLLKTGANTLVVRVTNRSGEGGFMPDKPYHLQVGDAFFPLEGTWTYRVGQVFPRTPPTRSGITAQDQPAALFNGMIAPFTQHAVRGFVWYQGESNAGDPESYRALLPNLIADWRHHWGLGDLVFLVAQLPNYMAVDYLPAESNWARMREAQMEVASHTTNTGVGINIDLGEWNDIHPGDKKPVGERLALQAMRLSYGETDVVASGPVFRSQRIEGDRIVLEFDHVGGGLVSRDGEPLAHFAVAGPDKRFRWARAAIEGDTVIVSHESIPAPRFVRYAWADNPDFANLANREGLPAAPFRTDR
jgi:sialate O-acetylesterase